MVELHTRVSHHGVNEALGIVCFHYWLLEECDESFNTHLEVLKALFCTLKKMGVIERWLMRCCVHLL
jgi:hypothetical protein